jgi:plasmid stability protein
MATLNVKNLPDGLYRKLRQRARKNRRSAAQEVTSILADALEEPSQLSIAGLRGLGKDLWRGVDAWQHVRQEREAWD